MNDSKEKEKCSVCCQIFERLIDLKDNTLNNTLLQGIKENHIYVPDEWLLEQLAERIAYVLWLEPYSSITFDEEIGFKVLRLILSKDTTLDLQVLEKKFGIRVYLLLHNINYLNNQYYVVYLGRKRLYTTKCPPNIRSIVKHIIKEIYGVNVDRSSATYRSLLGSLGKEALKTDCDEPTNEYEKL